MAVVLLALVVAGVAVIVAPRGPGDGERIDGPGAALDAPVDRVPGTELFRADFETGDLRQWDGVQRVAERSIQVVRDPVEQGRYAGRFEVREGDAPIDENDRAEVQLATDEAEGDVRWYAWSTMFAPDFPSIDAFQVVTQWRPRVADGPPSVGFYVTGDRISLQVNPYDAENVPARLPVTEWSGPIARGTWLHFRMRVHWSGDDDRGAIDLWVDGRHVVRDARIRTLYPGDGGYMKQGYYRQAGQAETGVLYHDGLRVSRP